MTVTVVELLEGNNAFPIVFLGNYQHIDATKSIITPYRKMQTLKHVPDSRTANAIQITFWSFIAKGNLNQLFDFLIYPFFPLPGDSLLSLNVTENRRAFWFIFFLFLCEYVHVVMQFFISGEILKCRNGWWVVDTDNNREARGTSRITGGVNEFRASGLPLSFGWRLAFDVEKDQVWRIRMCWPNLKCKLLEKKKKAVSKEDRSLDKRNKLSFYK